jgi:hypothetical protein
MQHLRRWSGLSSATLLSTLALAVCLPACAQSEDDPAVGGAGTGGTQGNPSPQADVGTMLTTTTTCSEPNTICMNLHVPSTMEGQPTRLMFDIYDSPGTPNHLPNGYAGVFTAPSMTAGAQLYFELSDAGLQGDYWMFAIMYMEGGGYGAPVNGVDYIMHSPPAALHLDGSPINVAEPIVLGL